MSIENQNTHKSVPKEVTDFMGSGEQFSLVWEPKLRAFKTQPVPSDLSPYYEHPNYLSHNEVARGWFARMYRVVQKWNIRSKLKWLEQANASGRRLLDYGCGVGVFGAEAQNKGWEIDGLEVSLGARHAAQKKGLSVFSNQSEVVGKTYDVITLWHVLEHLESPEYMSRWFSERLSNQGALVIAVPNYRAWDAKYYQECWAAYDAPRHLWHFSKTSIKTIFHQEFELLHTRPMWFDAIYVSLLSERYKKQKGNALRGVLVGVLSNLAAVITNEPSSRVYILKKRA
jgi:2-polyprenyl-3-methyl-5-hydroxy-6-metoxy-1,4-benzoquinol methylase